MKAQPYVACRMCLKQYKKKVLRVAKFTKSYTEKNRYFISVITCLVTFHLKIGTKYNYQIGCQKHYKCYKCKNYYKYITFINC